MLKFLPWVEPLWNYGLNIVVRDTPLRKDNRFGLNTKNVVGVVRLFLPPVTMLHGPSIGRYKTLNVITNSITYKFYFHLNKVKGLPKCKVILYLVLELILEVSKGETRKIGGKRIH